MVQEGIKKYRFIRLDQSDSVRNFNCGDRDLDNFRDKTEFNRFWKKSGFPNEKRLKSYPAVKLCRLGVDVSAKKHRIGTTILNYIKSMFVIDNKTGCRFLTVDAYLNAVPFYEKNGFRFMNSEDDDPHTRLMYFDLMDLVA